MEELVWNWIFWLFSFRFRISTQNRHLLLFNVSVEKHFILIFLKFFNLIHDALQSCIYEIEKKHCCSVAILSSSDSQILYITTGLSGLMIFSQTSIIISTVGVSFCFCKIGQSTFNQHRLKTSSSVANDLYMHVPVKDHSKNSNWSRNLVSIHHSIDLHWFSNSDN